MSYRSKCATAVATAASMAFLGVFGITACNSLTGAGDVRINPDFGEDDGGVDTGSTGGPAGTGGTTGSGSQTGSGSGAGTTGPTSSATSSSASTGSGMGGDPGATQCDYPDGPYGVGEGQIVPPTLTWQGFAPGASSPTTIAITDFFDCDGSRGINALYFDTSQFG